MGRRVLAAALVAVGLLAIPSGAAPSKTYTAPFAVGPSGGDSDGLASADPQGRVTVFRVYPAPGPINCPGAGHYATLKVVHKLTGPVHKVTAAYDQALVDPYVHVSVGVRDATGRWIGNTKPAGVSSYFRVCTMDECRYRLCGITVAPTMPMAASPSRR